MRREARLQYAQHWIKDYTGKNIIKGYRKWFGVDTPCAIKELKILGVQLDEAYIAQALANMEQASIARKKFREKQMLEINTDSDDDFYYIVGYTSNGFPYGVAWEAVLDN